MGLPLVLVGAALAAPIGSPGVAVPIASFGHPCLDPRYPALAGPWVVGCGLDGRVDRALSLRSGRELALPSSLSQPALAEGLLVAVGREAAVYRLSEDGASSTDAPLVAGTSIGPPATDGQRAALLSEGRVSAWQLHERSRPLFEAHPLPWFRPALSDSHLAWVGDGGPDLEDIWALDLTRPRSRPTVLAAGRGSQRHVVGHGVHLAWVDDDGIVILDTSRGERTRFPADTGFGAPPTLWEGIVCWEERPSHPPQEDGPGVDILCSDGLRADGPGHQRWPSRFGPWLLYREGDDLWLRTAAESASP